VHRVSDHLRARLLRGVESTSPEELLLTETNEKFFQLVDKLLPYCIRTPARREFFWLMRSNLLMGALRYHPLHAPGRLEWDCIGSILKRLVRYKEDHNRAHLVDIAALCLVEFTTASKPGMHYRSLGDGCFPQFLPTNNIPWYAERYLDTLNRSNLIHITTLALLEFTAAPESHYTPLSNDSDRIGTELL
jgi:hypothetical protein